MCVVSTDIEELSQLSTRSNSNNCHHVFACRSDVAKLNVIHSRIREMVKDIQHLQSFLALSVSGSTETHSFIQASLKSTELVFEGILSSILREQQTCITNLESKIPGRDSSVRISSGMITRFQVDDIWHPNTVVSFTSGGIEYQVKPPAGTKAGDWLEFDPKTCILIKLDK